MKDLAASSAPSRMPHIALGRRANILDPISRRFRTSSLTSLLTPINFLALRPLSDMVLVVTTSISENTAKKFIAENKIFIQLLQIIIISEPFLF